MNLAALALISCLVAQAAEDPESFERPVMRRRQSPPAQMEEPPAEEHGRHRAAEDEPPADRRYRQQPAEDEPRERLEPVDSTAKQKLRPPEIVAQALEAPRQGALVGTPMTLREAMTHVSDRGQQLKVAQAYWRLCTAQAEYHWARDERDALGHYTESHTTLPATLSARASARAVVRDAQLTVTQAQQDLADLIGMRPDASPPLASDRPHVGDYNTHYESIFSSRVPPPRIRLIHRTMPVRRRAIDAHGEAIVAAHDALEEVGEQFRQHGEGLTTVLAALQQLHDQRRAFMEDVRDYNEEIAEYACAVAPATTSGEVLVSMLIKSSTTARPAPRTRAADAQRATRATFEAQAPPPRTQPRLAPRKPSNAELRNSEAPRFQPAPPVHEAAEHEPAEHEPAEHEPADHARRAEDEHVPSADELASPPEDSLPQDEPPSRYNAPAEEEPPQEPALETPGEAEPQQHTSNYLNEDPAANTELYAGLLSIEGPARVQKLSGLLHWDRNLPRDAGRPISLVDCLANVSPGQRLAVLDSFWSAREQAARCQVLAEQIDQISTLLAIAVPMRDQEGVAHATVRLQAARKAARADLVDAERALLVAEYELTQAAQYRLDEPWLLPATAPQAGRYIVAAGRHRRVEPHTIHWAEMVRVEHEKLSERADAVVQADVNRAHLTEAAREGAHREAADRDEPLRLDAALRGVARQNQETLAFLHDLTEYNRAIARFAVVAWPANLPHDQLIKKLVIARSTRRDS